MSTTRLIFIIVCIVLAVIVFTIGIIIQKNDPDSSYSMTNVMNPRATKKRKKKTGLKNSGSYLTMFLLLVLVVLFLVFSRK